MHFQVFVPAYDWLVKRGLEKVHLLQKTIPVHLTPSVQKIEIAMSLSMSVTNDKFEKKLSYLNISITRGMKTRGDLSGLFSDSSAGSCSFAQRCIPRAFFVQNPAASKVFQKLDPLRVGIQRYVGYKRLNPKEFTFQAFRYKQDSQ